MRKLFRFVSSLIRRLVMPEYVTETREGMDNIADAIRTLAGVMASVAAGLNENIEPKAQRDMAGVIYADAQERFGDVLKKLDPKKRQELDSWLSGLCKGRR